MVGYAAKQFFETNLEAWRALEQAYAAGKLWAIGVSNFERLDLDNRIDNGSVKPMVNQVLAHVGNTPFDLIDLQPIERHSGRGLFARDPRRAPRSMASAFQSFAFAVAAPSFPLHDSVNDGQING